MLKQVLRAFEETQEPMSLADLALRLGVDQPALEGMLEYWVRKGRLRDEQRRPRSACGGCSMSCGSGAEECAFAGKPPRIYSLVGSEERGCGCTLTR